MSVSSHLISKRFVYSCSLLLFLAAGICVTGQKSADAPKQKERVSKKEVLASFLFTSRITKPSETVNKELIAEIAERKVDFVLDDLLSERIRKAGGSEELLTAIDKSLSDVEKVRLKDIIRLDALIRENYNGKTVEKIQITIKAGYEFIDKFADEPGYEDMVNWLKDNLPRLKHRIQ